MATKTEDYRMPDTVYEWAMRLRGMSAILRVRTVNQILAQGRLAGAEAMKAACIGTGDTRHGQDVTCSHLLAINELDPTAVVAQLAESDAPDTTTL